MKKLLALVATASLMFSCSQDEVTPSFEKLPINISMGVQTRANDTTYENGDKVGIYVVNYDGSTAGTLAASGNQVDNMRFTFNNGSWTPDETIYWKDGSTPADFYAYYPYNSSVASVTEYPFSVQLDQSSEENYWASDFLWGKVARVTPTPSAVSIRTKHSMSRIVVSIKPNGFAANDWDTATKSIKICGTKTQSTIDLSTGVATAIGDAGVITPLFIEQTNSTNTYMAMVVPQTIDDSSNFIVVTVDGKDYVYRKDYQFRANTQHNFSITVNKAAGSVDIAITEWDIDGYVNEGDALEENVEVNQVAEAVDLGLSVKWATWNVGASAPEDFGNYYAWGETESKSYYWWDTYKYRTSTSGITKYCTSKNDGAFVDGKFRLEPEDDVANVKWGDNWRMPTLEECEELVENCTWEWTEINGIGGYTITGTNGNSIFLPATGFREYADFCPVGQALPDGLYGFYWSKSLKPNYNSTIASGISFDQTRIESSGWNRRSNGHTIRPVYGPETEEIPNNQIWYTSTDGAMIEPNESANFGANIVSNTYENGKGVIIFDGEISTISGRAFYMCHRLSSITLPRSVTSIDNSDVFEDCDNLAEFNGKFASEDGRYIVIDNKLVCFAPAGLTTYVIPEGITEIGAAAFAWYDNIESITIPESVTKIGDLAFYNCYGLKEFRGKFSSEDGKCLIVDDILHSFAVGCSETEYIVPSNVATISACAFEGYTSLVSLTIPENVTRINIWAFRGCTNLTSVYFNSTTPPIIEDGLFDNVDNYSIYVPSEAVDTYKEAGEYWEVHIDKIFASPDGN